MHNYLGPPSSLISNKRQKNCLTSLFVVFLVPKLLSLACDLKTFQLKNKIKVLHQLSAFWASCVSRVTRAGTQSLPACVMILKSCKFASFAEIHVGLATQTIPEIKPHTYV